ncbi:MAG: FIST C-terminal domain-containing protein [Gammaproteobacteria bacterium]|nr:FIST C-terminal domain-containing protein [Gammaproteobacteria bacterium]MBU1723865.1 FIST C-terminal domain-containing protein [Gammaproteobacteria bacterium]MBU2004495.1 FIST C-terminal domain-containing protein [Gammaproteobacteria bacterium]
MHKQPFSSVLLTDTAGSVDSLFQHIDAAIAAGAKSLLLLASATNGFTPAQLDHKLRSLSVPVFGGIFPQILAHGTRMERGSIVYGLPQTVMVRHINNISAEDQDFTNAIDAFAADIPPGSTLMTLVDSAGKRIAAVLESLYEIVGDTCRYLGGGAGCLGLEPVPCLFSNAGLLQDCAQITAIGLPMEIGVGHGWRKFAGPFLVTGAYNNVITTLDYLPAFEVYRKVLEADGDKRCQESLLFECAGTYPFGLEKLEGDILVRSPLLRAGNKLVCVGEIPLNHMLYILKGQANEILNAARQCVQAATINGADNTPAFLFECASRAAFLGEHFSEEMASILAALPADTPVIGAITLGEIANNGKSCLEIHNKAIVLGVTPPQGKRS